MAAILLKLGDKLKDRRLEMATWKIGNVSVTRVGELLGDTSLPPEQFLIGFDREMLGRHRHWLILEPLLTRP